MSLRHAIGGASKLLSELCNHYIASQYFPDGELGSIIDGFRCENLESLTFDDNSVDIHVTQDVLEHVYHPDKVFSEIARTLKPGGAHIFTAPLVRGRKPTQPRVEFDADGSLVQIAEAIYHGNPVSEDGALVTYDWGLDICNRIFDSCGLFTEIFYFDDLSRGIRAELIEVLVTFKPANCS